MKTAKHTFTICAFYQRCCGAEEDYLEAPVSWKQTPVRTSSVNFFLPEKTVLSLIDYQLTIYVTGSFVIVTHFTESNIQLLATFFQEALGVIGVNWFEVVAQSAMVFVWKILFQFKIHVKLVLLSMVKN